MCKSQEKQRQVTSQNGEGVGSGGEQHSPREAHRIMEYQLRKAWLLLIRKYGQE